MALLREWWWLLQHGASWPSAGWSPSAVPRRWPTAWRRTGPSS